MNREATYPEKGWCGLLKAIWPQKLASCSQCPNIPTAHCTHPCHAKRCTLLHRSEQWVRIEFQCLWKGMKYKGSKSLQQGPDEHSARTKTLFSVGSLASEREWKPRVQNLRQANVRQVCFSHATWVYVTSWSVMNVPDTRVTVPPLCVENTCTCWIGKQKKNFAACPFMSPTKTPDDFAQNIWLIFFEVKKKRPGWDNLWPTWWRGFASGPAYLPTQDSSSIKTWINWFGWWPDQNNLVFLCFNLLIPGTIAHPRYHRCSNVKTWKQKRPIRGWVSPVKIISQLICINLS